MFFGHMLVNHLRKFFMEKRKIIDFFFTVFSRGLLGSIQPVLYMYGQLKPNIPVCEILNRNQPKWLEINRFKKHFDFS